MKTCKTCKHSYRGPPLLGWLDWLWEFAKCRRTDHHTVDPVSGKKVYKLVYCEIERKYDNPGTYCGPEGSYWEPRRPNTGV